MLEFRASPLQNGLARHFLSRRYHHHIAHGFRSWPSAMQSLEKVRRVTTEAGDNKSGHIFAGPNEGILFIDSKASVIDSRSFC